MANENYFTQERQEKINVMSPTEMNTILLELEDTQFWTAILKYLQERMVMIQGGIFTIDPVKETAKIAQYQGIMMGLSDLQGAVIQLKAQRDNKDNPTPVDSTSEAPKY